MPAIKIVLNPTAGMNSAKEKIPQIRDLLKKYNIEYNLEITERIGHAADIAEHLDANVLP